MEIADRIIDYLKHTYQPEAIIAYGSFTDGSANSKLCGSMSAGLHQTGQHSV